jgi:PAS domain S-box-containing protein
MPLHVMSDDWNFVVALTERLRPLRDPIEIQSVAVRLIGEHLQASRVNYAQIQGNEFVISRSYADPVVPLFPERGPVADFGKAVIDACRRGETVAVKDARTDLRLTDPERAQLLSHGIAALISVPLTKGGQWLATLCIHAAAHRDWTRDQIALAEVISERIWGAGERARAEDTLSRQAFLTQLNDTIRPLADPASILDTVCRLLGIHMQVNRVVYAKIDGDDCTVVTDYVDGVPSMTGRFPWASLVGSRTEEILQGGTLLSNDTSIKPHTAAEREALEKVGIGAYLCPLVVKGGRFVGAFGVHSREPRVWTVEECRLVQDVADRIWATLEHRTAEAELRANEERLAFLLGLNDALRPLSDPEEVQEIASRFLGRHLGANRVSYVEFHGNQYAVHSEYTNGVPSVADKWREMTVTGELLEALQRGESVVVDDVQAEPRLTDDNRAILKTREVAALVCTALRKSGRIVAAFGVSQVTPRTWTALEVGLVRDVAERTWDAVKRTRAEAALRDQQQHLRLALEASAGASWTWAAATNQVEWDDRFRPLYGFAPDAPPSTDAWLASVHEDDRPRLLALRQEMWTSRTKDSWESTYRIVRPGGEVAWIQSRGRVDRDAEGNATRLTGLDLDFTQHHRTEEALQARRDKEHDRALRTLLETATQGVVSVDASGVIVTANRTIAAMFGWSVGELIGRRIEELLPSTFRDAHMRHRNGYLAAPRARLMGGGLALVGQRKDGSTFPIEVSLNHVQTPGGGRAFAFVTDITDRQRAAAALQERTAELEYRTTQLSRMASDLTLVEQRAREQIARTLHDGLQQMLVISSLNLEQHLQRDSESGTAPSELLSEARHQLQEAMVAARSLNVELFPPVLQRAGLPAALRWLANWMHDKYKVDVHVVADDRADSARKDVRTLLFESVRELLFNVVKHAQVDRVALELALDAEGHLCITVSDQGIGFDPDGLDHRSETGHVGWGLFSIRERLTLLGGRLEIDTARGTGTRMRLVAPRGDPQPSIGGPSTAITAPGSLLSVQDNGGAAPGALRILIVDDHAAVRSAFRDILNEQPQLSVVGDASNGFEAIASAHTLRPDVILMDIAMPHMDGVEATMRIHSELPDILILGLSMQPRNAAAVAMEQAGARGFFVKGIDTKRLIEHLLAVQAATTRV